MKKLILFLILNSLLLCQYSGGSGTSEDPYLISTPQDVDSIRYNTSSYFQLINNIDMSIYTNWIPIPTYTGSFTGHINGKGYAISNLTIDTTGDFGTAYFGFLSRLLSPGKIRNIKFINPTFSIYHTDNDETRFGIVAGYSYSTSLDSIFVEDPNIDVFRSGHGDFHLGGLFGEVGNPFTLNNCGISGGSIVGEFGSGPNDRSGGGLIGTVTSITFNQCYIQDLIFSASAIGVFRNSEIGGFVGKSLSVEINNSFFKGQLDANNSGSLNKNTAIGGFAGHCQSSFTCNNSYTVYTVSKEYPLFNPGAFIGERSITTYGVLVTGNFCYADMEVMSAENILKIPDAPGFFYISTTDSMKSVDTYQGWDFSNIWSINSLANDGYPINYKLPISIISPLNNAVFFIGDSVEIIYSTITDSVIVTYPLGEIDTLQASGLDTLYYKVTTEGNFQISVASLDNASTANVNIVVYPETGSIVILSAHVNNSTSPLDVDMSVFTADIDSFRVFYSSDTLNWILIDSWTTDTSNVVNTTNINFDLFLIDGTYTKLYFKAEDARDTTTIIKPRKYHKTGQAYIPDKRICYYYSGHPLFTDWRFDVACQWAPLACYEGGVTLKKDNFVYPKYDPEYADTLNLSGYGYYKDIRWCGSCVNLEGQTVLNSRRCYSLFITNFLYSAGESVFLYVEDSLAGWYINPHKVDGSYTISPTHSYFSVTNQSYVYKGYQYWIDKTNSKVYVNDLVNNIDSILFCDYSDLHTSISEWVPPYFPTKDVSYAFSIFPYSKLYEHFYFSNYAWNITQEDLDILFNNQTILNTFVPELRIVDGGFNRSISIPLLGEPNDGRPLAYDIYLVEAGSDQWSGIDPNTGIIITRDYFRGIKPRANRHQKYPYNLKGR